jgi:hypothetical protein
VQKQQKNQLLIKVGLNELCARKLLLSFGKPTPDESSERQSKSEQTQRWRQWNWNYSYRIKSNA